VHPLKPTEDKRRWPRGQRFSLSPAGREATVAYRDAVAQARASGRAALDAALAAWAAPLHLVPADGVVLAELSSSPLAVPRLTEALETAGFARDEVRASVGRLADAGLVEAVPVASSASP